MRLIVTLFLTLWLAAAMGSGPSIRVQGGDWGAASPRDIEAVLRSVTEVMLPDFPGQADLRVVVRPSAAGPRVLAVKSADGEHQILLNVRDARWDQFAYQFSHELCHVFSNFERRAIHVARAHQWFEEAVCEAVSIVTLERVATRWARSAPHPAWSEYAPAFVEYAQRLMASEHRHLAHGGSLAAWYGANAAQMARDPYLRQKNELIATRLVELFRASGLQAVGYLNIAGHAAGLDGFLAGWYECCPEAQRPLVRRIASLFRT